MHLKDKKALMAVFDTLLHAFDTTSHSAHVSRYCGFKTTKSGENNILAHPSRTFERTLKECRKQLRTFKKVLKKYPHTPHEAFQHNT